MADYDPSAMRLALLEIAEGVKPMHEWLAGQVAYFLAQGYTPAEARAMSAAEFVAVFGQAIPREIPPEAE